jgi:hypothetical protein
MHGFVSTSRLIDEAETAIALCAAELTRVAARCLSGAAAAAMVRRRSN